MPNAPSYPPTGLYRGSARVALLCEGDVIGYDVQLLSKWCRSARGGRLHVDVWPCGTGDGIRALADSYGREVYIVGLEDRDFRTPKEAESDCEETFKELEERRGIAIRAWKSWKRNEIENYFLDDEVIVPVMCERFGCKEGDVHSSIEGALAALIPFQALHAAVYRTRRAWRETDPAISTSSSPSLFVSAKPKWTADGLISAEPKSVRDDLSKVSERWRTCFTNGELNAKLAPKAIVNLFEEYIATWAGMSRNQVAWRLDWMGKEVLKLIRQQLAAKASVLKVIAEQPVVWHKLKRAESDVLDRKLERELQGHLVKACLDRVSSGADEAVRAEFDSIVDILNVDDGDVGRSD